MKPNGSFEILAKQWECVKPPLRPSYDDIAIFNSLIDLLPEKPLRILILGVTQEILIDRSGVGYIADEAYQTEEDSVSRLLRLTQNGNTATLASFSENEIGDLALEVGWVDVLPNGKVVLVLSSWWD